jgi:hypothetical protein
MKVQQWGTYSVKDHLRPRAFVADVLLFDKLVIPRPPTAKELQAEGLDKPDVNQMDRWRRNNWDPDRQCKLLDILQEFDLAVELPWGGHAEHDWQMMFNKDKAESLQADRSGLTQSIQAQVDLAVPEEQAYIATGGVLALYVANQLNNEVARKLVNRAKAPGVPVEAVIAYASYADYEADQGVERADSGPPPVPAIGPYAMFGWEFFVPEDSSKSDAELLRQAAELASQPDFCETRQYFHGWLKQMYEGEVDRQDAYEKMQKMLSEHTKIMRKSGFTKAARYAAKVAQIVAPLAGLVGHAAGVATGVAASGAAFGIEQLIPMPQVPDRLRPAAVLYDARKFFGK